MWFLDWVFFKIDIILNHLFWWLSWNFNVLGISFTTLSMIIFVLMLVFYFFSILKLKSWNNNFSYITKKFVKNTVILILFTIILTKFNTTYITKNINTDCYDNSFITNELWITSFNYFNSRRFQIIKENLKIWENPQKIYCKVNNILVSVHYKTIKWNISKNKLQNIPSTLDWKQKFLTDIYTNNYWIIWKETNITNWNKWTIIYKWVSYTVKSYQNPIKWEWWNIALINYNDYNNYILVWLYNNSTNKLQFFMINSPLYTKKSSILSDYFTKLKNISPALLYISFTKTDWLNKININWNNYFTTAYLYNLLNNYDSNKQIKKDWIVWANISFNNWKFFDKNDNKLYDLDLSTNSYYYKLNNNSNITPFNWNIFISWILYLIFYMFSLASVLAILITFFLLIK